LDKMRSRRDPDGISEEPWDVAERNHGKE
jgi:hypothetical protein